jgi:hypothetical protein
MTLQTTSGRWVAAVNGGDGAVISGTNYVNTDETFVLGTANGGITFGTRKTPRRYVVAEDAGGGAVNTNRPSAGHLGVLLRCAALSGLQTLQVEPCDPLHRGSNLQPSR